MNKLMSALRTFAVEEDGAQIIEYALIVAVVSMGLILAVQAGLLDGQGAFNTWLTDVSNCLTTGTCARGG